MQNEKADDGQTFVTCTYCGTQTQLSLKQLESDRPLKCRMCGAPFVIEGRVKTTAARGHKDFYRQCTVCGGYFPKKRMVEHNYMFYCWACFAEMEDQRTERERHTVLVVSGSIIAIIVICLLLFC